MQTTRLANNWDSLKYAKWTLNKCEKQIFKLNLSNSLNDCMQTKKKCPKLMIDIIRDENKAKYIYI